MILVLAVMLTLLNVLVEAVVLGLALDVGEVSPVGQAEQEVALHVGRPHEEVRGVGPVAVAALRVAVRSGADVLELGRGQPQQPRRGWNSGKLRKFLPKTALPNSMKD